MTLVPGTTVGRYQILEPLGQGSMATVYKAFQPSLQREVALKVLRPGYAQDQEFRGRFEREAIAIARLRHPHIVQVFDFEVAQSGEYVLAMEFLEGGTLKKRLVKLASEGRGIDPAESVRIIAEVSDALSYAHEKGIVHRDVKPSNVMLTHKDRAVVTDFGIARILGATSHTQTGVGIGTPEYMAPEQGQGQGIDHRADIYSLGAMAYELLTGRVPYSADTPLAVVLAHIKDPLPLPSKVNPTIGKGVERALLKALAKDPAQRFDSATAFADALRAGLAEDTKGGTIPTVVVRGAAAAAPTPRRAPAAPKQVTLSVPPILSQRPVVLAIAGALVLAVVAGTVLASNALRASPAASLAPTLGGTFASLRGPLIYQAKFDANSPGEITVNGTINAQKVTSGELEITTPAVGEQVEVVFNTERSTRYAAEMQVSVSPGSIMRFAFCPRMGPVSGAQGFASYCLTIMLTSGGRPNMELRYTSAGAMDLVGKPEPIAIPAGSSFRLGAVVDRSLFRFFIDDREVMQRNDDRLAEPGAPPLVQVSRLGSNPNDTGSVRVRDVRIYRLAGQSGPSATLPAAAASAQAATPGPSAPPKFAVPAKGKLVYEAKLDGTGNDLNRPITQFGDPTATAIRQVSGAIELELLKPTISNDRGCPSSCVQASATFAMQRRSTYVGEIDLQVAPKSDMIVHFQLYNLRGAGYYLALESVGPDGGDGVVFLGCAPVVPNCPVKSVVSDLVRVPTGRAFTLAVVLEETRITLYLDQKEASKVATLMPLNGLSTPTFKFSGPRDVPGTGLVRIVGVRFYDLP